MADGAEPITVPTFDDHARFWLAVIVIGQFVAVIGAILYMAVAKVPVPDGQMIITAEINFLVFILGFYFGSSSASALKDKILGKIGNGNGGTTT